MYSVYSIENDNVLNYVGIAPEPLPKIKGMIRVIHTFNAFSEAEAYKQQWQQHVIPPARRTRSVSARAFRVQCVTTGEEFASVTEAAARAGVSKQMMSMHLNGNPRYRRIRNMEYLKI
ncbi:hypothetical protein [Rhizobium phage RHph_X2_24]|nr:hypothetical protein [Rhizobium phage RHph_X2_24]